MKKNRNPIIIPNQSAYENFKGWMIADKSKQQKEREKELHNQKLLALKNHK